MPSFPRELASIAAKGAVGFAASWIGLNGPALDVLKDSAGLLVKGTPESLHRLMGKLASEHSIERRLWELVNSDNRDTFADHLSYLSRTYVLAEKFSALHAVLSLEDRERVTQFLCDVIIFKWSANLPVAEVASIFLSRCDPAMISARSANLLSALLLVEYTKPGAPKLAVPLQTVSFVLARRGKVDAYYANVNHMILSESWRAIDHAEQIRYYRSSAESLLAIIRHLHDRSDTPELLAKDLGRLVSLRSKLIKSDLGRRQFAFAASRMEDSLKALGTTSYVQAFASNQLII